MIKIWILLLISLSFASCGKGGSESQYSAVDIYATIGMDDPVPANAETFEVNISFINFTDDQKQKMLAASEIIKQVIATDEFKDRVLGHSYNGVTTFVDNGGQSNSTIYQHILDGGETLKKVKNNAMDVEVELYYENNTTIGYTYADSKRIWVNTKYFNIYNPAQVAANLFHEWLHKMGYKHSVSYSLGRDYSVPYAVGRIMGNIGLQFL